MHHFDIQYCSAWKSVVVCMKLIYVHNHYKYIFRIILERQQLKLPSILCPQLLLIVLGYHCRRFFNHEVFYRFWLLAYKLSPGLLGTEDRIYSLASHVQNILICAFSHCWAYIFSTGPSYLRFPHLKVLQNFTHGICLVQYFCPIHKDAERVTS